MRANLMKLSFKPYPYDYYDYGSNYYDDYNAGIVHIIERYIENCLWILNLTLMYSNVSPSIFPRQKKVRDKMSQKYYYSKH